MSKSKKPRRAYDPDRQVNRRKSRLLLAHDQAIATQPLDRIRIVKVMVQGREALDAITLGKGTRVHAEFLASLSNVAKQLCEMGLGTDEDDAIAKDGRDAILALAHRRNDMGRWCPRGVELQALRAMLDLREAQLESTDNTNGLEIEAARAVDRRIAEGNVIRVVEIVDSREAVAA